MKSELIISTTKGNIKGRLQYDQRHQEKTTIICHGLLNNKYSPIIQDLERIIFNYTNTFFFDFIGHGDSDGCTTYSDYDSQVDQLESIIRFINTFRIETELGKINLKVKILTGHSKGSNIIMLYKSKIAFNDDIIQIVCLCPRFDLSVMSNHRFSKWKEQIEKKQKFIWKWYHTSHGNKPLYVDTFDVSWRNDFKVEIYNSIKGLDIHLIQGIQDSVVLIQDVDNYNRMLNVENNVKVYKLENCDHFFHDNQKDILNSCLVDIFNGIRRLTDNKL